MHNFITHNQRIIATLKTTANWYNKVNKIKEYSKRDTIIKHEIQQLFIFLNRSS